jgi:hypothetical protein
MLVGKACYRRVGQSLHPLAECLFAFNLPVRVSLEGLDRLVYGSFGDNPVSGGLHLRLDAV